MTNPPVYVVKQAEWEAFVERVTEAAYEKLDNFFDRIGLNGCIDVNARAFAGGGTIFIEEKSWKAFMEGKRDARLLVKHEVGHEWKVPRQDHPTTFGKGLQHAMAVGFDDRAYTGFLRFREYKENTNLFEAWARERRNEWVTGKNFVKPAPE